MDLEEKLINTIEEKTSSVAEFRTHLGASVIGKKCERAIWFHFRWIDKVKIKGRFNRIFNRGHREESHVIENLKKAGCLVKDFDSNGKQFKILDCQGHFGGSLDGLITIPDFDIESVLEIKTMKEKYFNQAVKHGFQKSHPQYFDQMCVYGYKFDLSFGVFYAVNKNDDRIHIEIIDLDFERGKKLIEKANGIIFSKNPPHPISTQPSYYICKMCDYYHICFSGTGGKGKNCRKCRSAVPVENGEWFCETHGDVIPKEFVKTACDKFYSILYGNL